MSLHNHMKFSRLIQYKMIHNLDLFNTAKYESKQTTRKCSDK
jgi:hypothetical protein